MTSAWNPSHAREQISFFVGHCETRAVHEDRPTEMWDELSNDDNMML